MKKFGIGALVVVLAATAVLTFRPGPASGVVISGYFTDDNGRTLEADIDAIAAAGITRGCNPPANTRFCPVLRLTRGEMAAFLVRALEIAPSGTNHFTDDNGHLFEAEINALAAADITRGCNPPQNSRFCPNDPVTREQMAAFIRRALNIPYITLHMPMAEGSGFQCKSTSECRVTYDVVAGRQYTVREGHFLVLPAASGDSSAFSGSGTTIELTVNGSSQSTSALPESTEGSFRYRMWSRSLTFSSGNHTVIVTWRWNGEIVRRTVATVRAG